MEAMARRLTREMIERRRMMPTAQVRYDRPPDHVGPHGEAWLVGDTGWVLHLEWAHPAWEYWLVSWCHLRDTPGVKPATLQFPGATHEVIIASLDPSHPLPTGPGTAMLLRPLDVVHQVQLYDDRHTQDLVKLMIEACCAGHTSPDQDYRSWWEKMLTNTAAHLRGEHDS